MSICGHANIFLFVQAVPFSCMSCCLDSNRVASQIITFNLMNQKIRAKRQGSQRDKIGPVTKINEIWQYCMCMSSVIEKDSF